MEIIKKIINYFLNIYIKIYDKYFNKINIFNKSNDIVDIIWLRNSRNEKYDKEEKVIKNYILKIVKESNFVERFNNLLKSSNTEIKYDYKFLDNINNYKKNQVRLNYTYLLRQKLYKNIKKWNYKNEYVVDLKESIIKELNKFIKKVQKEIEKKLQETSKLFFYKPSLDLHKILYIDFFLDYDTQSYMLDFFYYINIDNNYRKEYKNFLLN